MNESVERRLQLYQKQEEKLQFKTFNNKNAWEIGSLLVEQAQRQKAMVAIDIRIHGYQVFRYGFDGTNLHNDMWIARKANTVNTILKSSIHVGAMLEKQDQKIGEDWYLDPRKYAFCGGGFPITIEETGVIGSICVSGLTDVEDHQMIVDILERYLGEKTYGKDKL
ncbi:MAG: heme-degrading domain-containing protein [Lachnospiraceae bacterium]